MSAFSLYTPCSYFQYTEPLLNPKAFAMSSLVSLSSFLLFAI